jgi:cytochrome c nitrite reductase small subunit
VGRVSTHGTSYLSSDPAVCINCHIMQEQYDGWLHGSHHAVAVCNDCHLPHDNVVLKPVFEYQGKAQWRLDFVNAENSMGFHAPQEAARILAGSIDFARQGQHALRDLLARKS